MGKTIHFKSGVEPIHITVHSRRSTVSFGFTLVAQFAEGPYRGSHAALFTAVALIPQSEDLANTGVIPPGDRSISTEHLRAWEMMTSWVNRFRGPHKIRTNLTLT